MPIRAGEDTLRLHLAFAHHRQPAEAEIIVDARLTPPVRRTPLRLMRLDTLPPLPPSPIQKHLDLFVPSKIPLQMVPKVGLLSRHNKQVANHNRLSMPHLSCHLNKVMNMATCQGVLLPFVLIL